MRVAPYHEVESRHKEDHVNEQKPMLLERNSSLLDERFSYVARVLPKRLTFKEGLSFRKAQSEDDDEDG